MLASTETFSTFSNSALIDPTVAALLASNNLRVDRNVPPSRSFVEARRRDGCGDLGRTNGALALSSKGRFVGGRV